MSQSVLGSPLSDTQGHALCDFGPGQSPVQHDFPHLQDRRKAVQCAVGLGTSL